MTDVENLLRLLFFFRSLALFTSRRANESALSSIKSATRRRSAARSSIDVFDQLKISIIDHDDTRLVACQMRRSPLRPPDRRPRRSNLELVAKSASGECDGGEQKRLHLASRRLFARQIIAAFGRHKIVVYEIGESRIFAVEKIAKRVGRFAAATAAAHRRCACNRDVNKPARQPKKSKRSADRPNAR